MDHGWQSWQINSFLCLLDFYSLFAPLDYTCLLLVLCRENCKPLIVNADRMRFHLKWTFISIQNRLELNFHQPFVYGVIVWCNNIHCNIVSIVSCNKPVRLLTSLWLQIFPSDTNDGVKANNFKARCLIHRIIAN